MTKDSEPMKDTPQSIVEAYKVITEGEQQAAAMEKALEKIEAQIALMESQLSKPSSSYSNE